MTQKQESLVDEVKYFHHQLFNREAPAALVNEYLRAHAEIPELLDAEQRQLLTIEKILSKKLDAPGIEVWLRRGQVRHILTRKLLLLAYLAECDTHHPESTHCSTTGWRGWTHIGKFGAIGSIRLVRGYSQKLRYGLL